MKKCAPKKMANGGMAKVPAQGQAGMARRPAMPAQANNGGAMRGQARAAAMSGRTFANGGKVYKSKVVKKGSC